MSEEFKSAILKALQDEGFGIKDTSHYDTQDLGRAIMIMVYKENGVLYPDGPTDEEREMEDRNLCNHEPRPGSKTTFTQWQCKDCGKYVADLSMPEKENTDSKIELPCAPHEIDLGKLKANDKDLSRRIGRVSERVRSLEGRTQAHVITTNCRLEELEQPEDTNVDTNVLEKKVEALMSGTHEDSKLRNEERMVADREIENLRQNVEMLQAGQGVGKHNIKNLQGAMGEIAEWTGKAGWLHLYKALKKRGL